MRHLLHQRLLLRLVALNAERQREEAAGRVRWVRPAFQQPQAVLPAVDGENGAKTESTVVGSAARAAQSPWPAALPDQMALLARLLDSSPQSLPQLASRISGKGAWKKRLPDLLQTLVALGRARQDGDTWRAA